MAGLLEFAARFGTEERCIEHLAGLRWPGGFVCAGCGRRQAWRLKARPLYERALAICEKALGPEHPHTALSLNNLAVLLNGHGDLAV